MLCPCAMRVMEHEVQMNNASHGGRSGAPKGAGHGQLLAETCVVSAAFLEGLQQRALEQARAAADEALAARRESSAAASVSGQADGELAPSHRSQLLIACSGTPGKGSAWAPEKLAGCMLVYCLLQDCLHLQPSAGGY